MSLHAESVPAFRRTLKSLSQCLDIASKDAEERGYDLSVLLESRLAPDQFNLTRNLQSACDTAKFVGTRLGGVDAPKHKDGPATLAELQARIEEVRSFLSDADPAAFERKGTETLTLMRGMTMVGEDYLRQFAVPNFFFHASMSYAILRHNGVKVGKRDFLGDVSMTPPPQKA